MMLKPNADAYDPRLDAYRGWLYALAWQAAHGDRVKAEQLWREWCRLHGC